MVSPPVESSDPHQSPGVLRFELLINHELLLRADLGTVDNAPTPPRPKGRGNIHWDSGEQDPPTHRQNRTIPPRTRHSEDRTPLNSYGDQTLDGEHTQMTALVAVSGLSESGKALFAVHSLAPV
ncbi:hypothetical protein CC2G_005165 [Coprinopsis cinerea AmutBmut pab1-1]|nr:hypothetical protein CC2G_005165 [Coprinopsis cinerea AmutBmut pab1-1]